MLPLGKQQSLDHTHNRLFLCKTPITAPISKNSFILPGNVVSSGSSLLKTMTERKDRRLMLHVKTVELYSSGKKRSERHWSSCPAVSLQPLLTTTDYFSHLNQSYSDALNHLHHRSTITRNNWQRLLQVLQHQLLQAPQHLHQLLHNSFKRCWHSSQVMSTPHAV